MVVDVASYKDARAVVVGSFPLRHRLTLDALPSRVGLYLFQLDFALFVSLGFENKRCLRQDGKGEEGMKGGLLFTSRPALRRCLFACLRASAVSVVVVVVVVE